MVFLSANDPDGSFRVIYERNCTILFSGGSFSGAPKKCP